MLSSKKALNENSTIHHAILLTTVFPAQAQAL
jgi:hypothetical protein